MLQRSLTAVLELSDENEAAAYALVHLGDIYCMKTEYDLAEEVCQENIAMIAKLYDEHDIKDIGL